MSPHRYGAMTRKIPPVVLLLDVILLLFTNEAEAGPGDYAADGFSLLKRLSPVEQIQYYSYGGDNYCWYDEGWQGPGWYWCGEEWDNGFGWGGPYGWNGWGGGYLIRRHAGHGVGVWHPGAPNHVYGGASSPGLGAGGVPTSPGLQGGGFPAFHNFGGGHNLGAGGLHGPAAGGAPASPGFQGGGVPAFHGFGGGGGGFRGFGGAGGFHGGAGGAFSFGGHGGGHR